MGEKSGLGSKILNGNIVSSVGLVSIIEAAEAISRASPHPHVPGGTFPFPPLPPLFFLFPAPARIMFAAADEAAVRGGG